MTATTTVDGWWRRTTRGVSGGVSEVRTRAPRVAFQGERGAYGDEAIARLWEGAAFPVPSWRFNDVVAAVVQGKAEYGILPIENTVVGPIAETRALLDAGPEIALEAGTANGISLSVVDEITIEVRHALMAPKGATLSTLCSVASHPVALRQCGRFLAQHPQWTTREAYDTAGAAREVAAHGKLEEAAIASVRAAERYQLTVLAEEIQDVPNNWTRFVVVAPTHRVHRRDRW